MVRPSIYTKLAVVAYALLVAYMSLRPLEIPQAIEHTDKVLHFAAYGVFTFLAYIAGRTRAAFYMSCVGIILYGGLIELVQDHLPYRQMSAFDFVANSLGVGFAAVCCVFARKTVPAVE